jgi:hypothetical protein
MLRENSTLDELVSQAIRVDATALDVEYKAGYEEVCVLHGAVGWGIARFPSSTPEATSLRQELHRLTRKRRRVTVDGHRYELRSRVRDSFGEIAYRVELRRV